MDGTWMTSSLCVLWWEVGCGAFCDEPLTPAKPPWAQLRITEDHFLVDRVFGTHVPRNTIVDRASEKGKVRSQHNKYDIKKKVLPPKNILALRVPIL